jgi:molecular chaperone HscB
MTRGATSAAPRTDDGAVRCWQCGAAQAPAPLCASCAALLPLPPDANPYQIFGITRRLDVDTEGLSRRYYELSRLLHPDGHASSPPEALQASMQNTAALTRAYRTLRDPVARGRHWLEMHGENLGDDNRVPPELAARVFEVQEKLDDLRGSEGSARESVAAEIGADLEVLRAAVAESEARLEKNFRAWGELGSNAKTLLAELKNILSRRAYLATLVRDVESALEVEGEKHG